MKWEKKNTFTICTGQNQLHLWECNSTHSVLKRRLMEFIHGGNGNVDSLFISFALSSVCC